jgi:hypothetical protein
MIAVVAHGLNANDERARAWAQSAHARAQHLNSDDFLRAFPFRDPVTRARISEALERFGF